MDHLEPKFTAHNLCARCCLVVMSSQRHTFPDAYMGQERCISSWLPKLPVVHRLI